MGRLSGRVELGLRSYRGNASVTDLGDLGIGAQEREVGQQRDLRRFPTVLGPVRARRCIAHAHRLTYLLPSSPTRDHLEPQLQSTVPDLRAQLAVLTDHDTRLLLTVDNLHHADRGPAIPSGHRNHGDPAALKEALRIHRLHWTT